MKLNKVEILTLLKESKDYISGQELCERYHASRTAIWKLIRQLKEEGYQIDAVQNKGYRLIGCPDVLSAGAIKSGLTTKKMGQELHYHPVIGSTNTEAKRLGEEGAPEGTLVAADQQTGGKGRRGRVWQSPSGCGIYFTILLRPQMNPSDASMITLVIAYSVVRAIRQYLGTCVGIKWPNDIVWEGKKIAGILTEMTLEADYISYVVVGVGINVNNESFEAYPEEVRERATSLQIACGHPVSRAELLQKICECFEEDYEAFVRAGDLEPFAEMYNTMMVNYKRVVRVLDPKGEFEGTARGINRRGELLVETADGNITEVYAGEVSVRGVYGYV